MKRSEPKCQEQATVIIMKVLKTFFFFFFEISNVFLNITHTNTYCEQMNKWKINILFCYNFY